MPPCPQHPDVEVVLSCASCGRGRCGNCLLQFRGRILCGACKDREARLEQMRAEFTAPQAALIWAIAGFFCCQLVGVVGIVKSAGALKSIGRDPRLPGRPIAILALILSIAQLGLLLLGLLFYLGIFAMVATTEGFR